MKRLILILAMLSIAAAAKAQSSLPFKQVGAYCLNAGTWIPVNGAINGTGLSIGVPQQVSLYGLNAATTWYGLQCDASGNLTPGGAAGGDLSGTYPNPTVSSLKGVALPTLAAGCLESAGASGPFSWTACATSTPSFSVLSSGTNTTAAMLVGTGASLAASGSGTITATAVPASGLTGSTLAAAVTASSLTSLGGGAVGTAAFVNTGTSGATIPLYNAIGNFSGANNFSGSNSFTAAQNFNATGTATSGANFPSNGLNFKGSYWNSSAAAANVLGISLVNGTGTNPTQTAQFMITGSDSGAASYLFGQGATGFQFNISAAFLAQFSITNLTAGRVYQLPDAAGTVALAPGVQAFGIATLAAGTVTVSNAAACTPSATCVYKLTNCALNGTAAVGTPGVGTISVGTSFVINSYTAVAGVAVDVSKICWQIN